MAAEERESEVPDVIEDFSKLLEEYGVKKAPVIAKYLADTGGPQAFDSPEIMAKKLAAWPRNIPPITRQTVMEHWFKLRGVDVPEELLTETGLDEEKREERKRKREREAAFVEGENWVVTEDGRIRMAKENERGITLDEAKTALKEIARVSGAEEPIVVFNEDLGRHMPNFKSEFVKGNLAVAWAAARSMDRAVSEGETVDPMDAFIDQMARIEMMREAIGAGRRETAPKEERPTSLSDVVSAVKDLKDMSEEKKGVLPDWMSDPLEFQRTIKELTKGEGEETKALREQIAELSKALQEMKEQRILDQVDSYRGEVRSLKEKLEDLTGELRESRHVVGSTAIDLLRDAVDRISEKLPDRRDIREIAGEALSRRPRMPRGRGAAERERELEGMAGSLEAEAELRDIEDFWFFRERR